MAIKTVKTNLEASHYDDYPYESYPFPHANPEHLNTVGKLFGMKAPPIESSRILELGCAAGGNIMNLALKYPKSYVLGIDFSKVEIEHGQRTIKELGLKNIELKHQSIMEMDETMEKFDYIVCHGVFSWVPEFVRDKILDISKRLLSPNGIAMISYNTLPGWNMVNTIRDMMLFHSSSFEKITDKVSQSRLFMKFINESLEGIDTPYTNFLNEEARNLSTREDQYLRHEYLAEENIQFYFSDFVKLARAKGLNYLGESNLHSMYLGNMPEKAIEKLQVINDIIRTEQYMDFIQNRRFRCTLLTHNNVEINRNITPETLHNFYFTSNIQAEKHEAETDIKSALETVKFYLANSADVSIATSSPAMKSMLYTFIENEGNPINTDELFKLANKKLPSIKIEEFKNTLDGVIGKLIFTGYLKIFSSKPGLVSKISAKPKVNDYVRYQVKNIVPEKPWVTNFINDVVGLKPHEKLVIEKLDGKHTIEQINEHVYEGFANGILVASEGDTKVTSDESFKHLAKQCVELALANFKAKFLLIG